jgi:hypothetical protein
VHRSLRRGLGCALISVAFVGTLLTPAAAGAAESDAQQRGPGYHQPKVGSCHNLTLREFYAWSGNSAAVDCDGEHTSITLVVKRLRGKVDWTKDGIIAPIWFDCMRKTRRVLGGNDKSRALSAFGTTFFIPTKKERAHGAKWIRCDLALHGGKVLQPLPVELDLGAPPVDDSVARCLSGGGDSLYLTVCAKSHSYRTTGAFKARGKKYPGERRLAAQALRRCPDLVTSRHYRYAVPLSQDQWKAGYRTIVCYSKTKK